MKRMQNWKLCILLCSDCSQTPPPHRVWKMTSCSEVCVQPLQSNVPPKQKWQVAVNAVKLSPLQCVCSNYTHTHTHTQEVACGSMAFSSKVLSLFFSYIIDCLKQYTFTSTQPSTPMWNNKTWQKVIGTSPYVIIRSLNLKHIPRDYYLSTCEFSFFTFRSI